MLPSFADRCTVGFWGKQVDLEEGYLCLLYTSDAADEL